MALPLTTTTSGGKGIGGPHNHSSSLPFKKRRHYMTGFAKDQQLYPHPAPATSHYTRKITMPVNGVTDGTTQFTIHSARNEMIRYVKI